MNIKRIFTEFPMFLYRAAGRNPDTVTFLKIKKIKLKLDSIDNFT
jgi:hypothetical protein